MALPPQPRIHLRLWLPFGVLAVALAWPLDNRVDAAMAISNNPSLQRFAWWCSELGQGWVPVAAGLAVIIFLVLLHRTGAAAKVCFVMLTCTVTGLAASILRLLTGRTRPLAAVPQGFYGVWYHGHWIIGKYEFSSFPSGHSGTAAGLAAAAWLVHRGWGAVAVVYALAVMWSRIALQCHHLSDVVASVVLSIPLAVMLKKTLLPSIEFHFNNLRRSS